MTSSLKLLLTQSVVINRIRTVSNRSDERILTTTFDSVPATARTVLKSEPGNSAASCLRMDSSLSPGCADLDGARYVRDSRNPLRRREWNKEFAVFRCSRGNDAF